MAKRTKAEQEALDALEYILLDVSKNLWLAPDGFSDGKNPIGFTTEPGEAKRVLRPLALSQFVESCNKGADYRVPVRVVDIVACSMGIEE